MPLTTPVTPEQSARTIRSVIVFIFCMSVGEGITGPAIPLQGSHLGGSFQLVGFFMTGYAVAYTLMALLAGRISDRLGRKRLLLFAIGASIVASTGYYLAWNPTVLLISRTLEGFSRGILWPVVEAILADNSTAAGRGRVMGRFTAAYGAGDTLGTLAGGFVMQYLGLTAVFPVYPILGAVVLVTCVLGITEVPQAVVDDARVDPGLFDRSAMLEEFKRIWAVCVCGFAYGGLLYSVMGLMSKVADVYGVTRVGIGVIFALFWAMRTGSFWACGELSDRYGCRRMLLTGLVCCVVGAGLFLAADAFALLAGAAVLGGIGSGLCFPLLLTLTANYGSREFHGFDMGLLEGVIGIGMILLTALSSVMGQHAGVGWTYLFVFIANLVALVIAWGRIHDRAPATLESLESG